MQEEIKKKDLKLFSLIAAEEKHQRESINLIPSENYASPVVLQALASELNGKYAEGYPGKRYYGGNQFIDKIELLCQKRAQELFKTNYFVNVQPYSGSPANIAVYLALLQFRERVLSLSLDQGGHLTHGHKVNFSGKAYEVIHYGVNPKNERLDFSEIARLAQEFKPKLIICGYTAYPRTVDFSAFAEIAKKVGAYLLADISHIAGFVAWGLHPSPFGYADVVTTTLHKILRGPRSAMIFSKNEEIAQKINKAVFPGLQGGPHMHTIASMAVALKEAKSLKYKKYVEKVIKNCQALAQALKDLGFRLVSGGSDNHLLLIDLRELGVSGKEAEQRLDRAGIIVNKNTIPFDPNPPLNPSGIRIGTQAVTTRGMGEKEMVLIAQMIKEALLAKKESELALLKTRVKKLAKSFPLFKE